MAKLTESQKLIRLLQTKFSNKDLSSLLGYKGTSQVRKISSGRSNPSPGVFERIQRLVTENNINTDRRAPRPSEVKQKQQSLRKFNWVSVSRETFLSSFALVDLFQLQAKLDKLMITNFYYNESIESFFISNKPNKNPVTNQVTGFLFQISMTKKVDNIEEIVVVQYPVYPIITIVSDLPSTFQELYYIILEYMREVAEANREDSFSEQLYYNYLKLIDDGEFLAFVSIL